MRKSITTTFAVICVAFVSDAFAGDILVLNASESAFYNMGAYPGGCLWESYCAEAETICERYTRQLVRENPFDAVCNGPQCGSVSQCSTCQHHDNHSQQRPQPAGQPTTLPTVDKPKSGDSTVPRDDLRTIPRNDLPPNLLPENGLPRNELPSTQRRAGQPTVQQVSATFVLESNAMRTKSLPPVPISKRYFRTSVEKQRRTLSRWKEQYEASR